MQNSRFFSPLAAVCIALLFMVGCATAPEDDTVEAELIDDDQGELFLWTVEYNEAVLHIYGSIHLATADVYPLPDIVYDLFESSDRLVLEIDLETTGPEAFFGVQSLMEYPAGGSLEDDLTSDEIELLSNTLAEIGIPFDMVKELKPWVIEATIVSNLASQQGIDAEHGIDMHFAQLASDLEMPVDALETVEDQLSIFGNLPSRTQAAELMRTITNYQDINAYIEQLLEIWRDGDLNAMKEILSAALLADPNLEPYYDAMFAGRNRKWIDQLSGYLQSDEEIFAVVGTGHLVGPDNVIELLRAQGFRAIRH